VFAIVVDTTSCDLTQVRANNDVASACTAVRPTSADTSSTCHELETVSLVRPYGDGLYGISNGVYSVAYMW